MKLRLLVFLPALSLSLQAQPQNKSHDPLDRASPQSTVLAFLETCRAKNYDRAVRFIDLSRVAPEHRLDEGPRLAKELEQVLERDAQFDVAELSPDPQGDLNDGLAPDRERVAHFEIAHKPYDLELQRGAIRQGVAIWRFAPESVELIPKLALGVRQSPIERHLPVPLVRWQFLDTSLWRWIAIVILIAVAVALSRLVSIVGMRLARPLAERLAPRSGAEFAARAVGPIQCLLWTAIFSAGLEWIEPATLARLYLHRAAGLISIAGLAWLAALIIDGLSFRLRTMLEASHRNFSYSVLPMVARFVKVTILVFAIIALLSSWGYNTSTILAGLGIGGIAIALAAQKTIENVFGGVAVITDRPVNVGDMCKFGDRMGTVEDIGMRSTRLRTLDRTLVTVPNSAFSAMTLENFSRRDKMWFHHTLNLRRETTAEQVRAILESVHRIFEEHRSVEAGDTAVRFIGVGSYSLDIEVFAYVLTADGDEFLRIQQDLLLQILDAVQDAGTALALPTQASITYSPQPARDAAAGPRR
jgi:MscS family membrane protein